MAKQSNCVSCAGTGEIPSERGPLDCPDCGGTGCLPSRATLVDWRSRDIERATAAGKDLSAEDARWMLSELRNMRTALTEIIALAHDVQDSDEIALRIRVTANRALGIYDVVESGAAVSRASGEPTRA
jgi:hypothetical protein